MNVEMEIKLLNDIIEKLKSSATKEDEIANKFAEELRGDDRLFDDPDNDQVIGIYYNPNSSSGGEFVLEKFPYTVIFEAMRFFNPSNKSEFLEWVMESREPDECYERGTEHFAEFAREWKDRIDYRYWSVDTLAEYACGQINQWKEFL